MQVSLENVGKLERKLTVKFPADQLDSKVQRRISELCRSTRLKGFRPGRVPVKVIEQRFGRQVRGEVLSDLIGSTFREAVQTQNLQPVTSPSFDTDGTPQDGEIAYTATFEVMPQLPTADMAILKIDRGKAEVGEADVDKMIQTLRDQRRTFAKVERAAAAGDKVTFDYAARSGEHRHPAEGREDGAMVLRENPALAAFDDALMGHVAGDELQFEAELPAAFPVPELAAKQCMVELRVGEVQEPHLPDVDAEFVHTFGVADGTVETFRKEIRANLERELETALQARLRNEVGGKLAAAYADVDVPMALETAEAEALVRATMGQRDDAGSLPAAALEAARPIARRRVIAALLLHQIARSNDMRVDDRRVTERVAKIASTYEDPRQVVELYRRNPQLMDNVRTAVLEDQVSEWVADHADTTELALTFEQVMHPQQPTA